MTKKSKTTHPGIYTITNILTGTKYVGQATNITTRLASHRRELKRNKHGTRKDRPQIDYLQRAWNKYGESNFIFEVYKRIDEEDRVKLDTLLDIEEVEALRIYQHNCYNIMEAGISGMVASEETIQKLSAHNKEQWKKPEHRAKIAAAQKAAWNEPGRKEERIAQYKEAFKKPEYKARRKEISTQFWAPGGCLRETQSEKRKANWQNPEYIAKQKASREAAWKNPEIREKRSKAIKETWARRKAAKLEQNLDLETS